MNSIYQNFYVFLCGTYMKVAHESGTNHIWKWPLSYMKVAAFVYEIGMKFILKIYGEFIFLYGVLYLHTRKVCGPYMERLHFIYKSRCFIYGMVLIAYKKYIWKFLASYTIRIGFIYGSVQTSYAIFIWNRLLPYKELVRIIYWILQVSCGIHIQYHIWITLIAHSNLYKFI